MSQCRNNVAVKNALVMEYAKCKAFLTFLTHFLSMKNMSLLLKDRWGVQIEKNTLSCKCIFVADGRLAFGFSITSYSNTSHMTLNVQVMH
jgi:hypothetical protein